MSYTMTFDAPEKVISYVAHQDARSRDELARLFVSLLVERMGGESEPDENPFEAFCGSWDDCQFDEFQMATERTVDPIPGCFTCGETMEEVRHNVIEAATLMLEETPVRI